MSRDILEVHQVEGIEVLDVVDTALEHNHVADPESPTARELERLLEAQIEDAAGG